MPRTLILLTFTVLAVGCTIKPGEQKYRAIREVDTTGMTEDEAAEARRIAEIKARQQKALDDYQRTQETLRDVQRSSRGF